MLLLINRQDINAAVPTPEPSAAPLQTPAASSKSETKVNEDELEKQRKGLQDCFAKEFAALDTQVQQTLAKPKARTDPSPPAES